jgi:hypothetical protein
VSDGPQRRSVATLFTAQVKLQLAGRLQSLSEETEGAIAAQMDGNCRQVVDDRTRSEPRNAIHAAMRAKN